MQTNRRVSLKRPDMFAAKAIVEQKTVDERTAPEDVSSKDFNESNGDTKWERLVTASE
ncbi:hypothetical protein TIFTF001_028774 [Ficus carica]|uniref:Uncharacterized protein n=1 Tax=Ficus carica TaxID=3494 RepID=A0AA88DQY1_FICCA|nr:hypothetical protein TIFTF001_028774 [Ficus carica]